MYPELKHLVHEADAEVLLTVQVEWYLKVHVLQVDFIAKSLLYTLLRTEDIVNIGDMCSTISRGKKATNYFYIFNSRSHIKLILN